MNACSDARVTWAADGSDAAVLNCLARHLSASIGKRLALPGGSTPVSILNSEAGRSLDWAGAEIWPTDERDVPSTHPAHNGGMLTRALEGTGANVRPLLEGETPPAFDLVWLGVGMDGHIASLFPRVSVSDDAPAAVVRVTPDPLPPEAPFPRHTLTMQALLNTSEIILVMRGEAKRAMLEAALVPGSDLPVARLVRSALCPVTVYWSAT